MIARISAVVLAGPVAGSAAASAPPNEPCRQAYEREKGAENRFWRRCGNRAEGTHGKWVGSCNVQGCGEGLYDEWQNAVNARKDACP